MNLIKSIVDNQDDLMSWRQHLHQNPEIAYEEKDTSDFVAAKLESLRLYGRAHPKKKGKFLQP